MRSPLRYTAFKNSRPKKLAAIKMVVVPSGSKTNRAMISLSGVALISLSHSGCKPTRVSVNKNKATANISNGSSSPSEATEERGDAVDDRSGVAKAAQSEREHSGEHRPQKPLLLKQFIEEVDA